MKLASIDKYTITVERKGEGTFGTVYTGHYTNDPTCQFAFKFLKQPEKVTGFLQHNNIREATFLSTISDNLDDQNSPFIQIADILLGDLLETNQKELKHCLIIVMPLLHIDLGQLLSSSLCHQFGLKEHLMLIKKTINLILLCHSMKLAHRDLKPNNILIKNTWEFKLIDFGMIQFNPEFDHQEWNFEEDIKLLPNQQNDDIFDPRSTAINALFWRPPEQTFSYILFKNSKDQVHQNIYSRLKNGFYQDSYVLGIMLLEITLGTYFFKPTNKEEELGVEELIAQQLYVDKKYCNETFKQLYKQEYSKGQITNFLNIYNGSEFSELQYAVSWNQYSYEQLILKCLLVKYFDEIQNDPSLIAQIKHIRDIICDLTYLDVRERKTLLEIQESQQYSDLVNNVTIQDINSFNKQLIDQFGVIQSSQRDSANSYKQQIRKLLLQQNIEVPVEGWLVRFVVLIKNQYIDEILYG